ncbi:MAG: hypothetical protein KAX37_07210 [Opitutaceae bacterium]|nr:hypothetical protein [Opitutaceae bacterium]
MTTEENKFSRRNTLPPAGRVPYRVRFPGIVADAKRLKVSRIHLYLVLTGRRTSHRLLKRYDALHASAA